MILHLGRAGHAAEQVLDAAGHERHAVRLELGTAYHRVGGVSHVCDVHALKFHALGAVAESLRGIERQFRARALCSLGKAGAGVVALEQRSAERAAGTIADYRRCAQRAHGGAHGAGDLGVGSRGRVGRLAHDHIALDQHAHTRLNQIGHTADQSQRALKRLIDAFGSIIVALDQRDGSVFHEIGHMFASW